MVGGAQIDLFKEFVLAPAESDPCPSGQMAFFGSLRERRNNHRCGLYPERAPRDQYSAIAVASGSRMPLIAEPEIAQIMSSDVQHECLPVPRQSTKFLVLSDDGIFYDMAQPAALVMRQGRVSTLDLAGQRRAEDPIGDQARLARDEPDRIGGDRPDDKLIRQVKPRIGDFQQRQDMIGAVFLKIE